MLNNLFFYWMIAGIYCVIHGFIRSKFFMTEKKEKELDKISKITNIDKKDLLLYSYGFLLLLGGFVLPLWITEWIYKLITNKELIDINVDNLK